MMRSELEGMDARRQGLTERACPYERQVQGTQADRWLSGWETCDEEMKSLNVLTTAKDFAESADISQLNEYSQHLFRVMQHALREARSLTE
jgi:ribosome modulation factor